MHAEAAERAEWDAWDSTVGGVDGEIAIDQIRTVSRTRLGTIPGMIDDSEAASVGPPPEPDCVPIWAWCQWEGKRKKPDLRCRGHLPKGQPGVRLELEVLYVSIVHDPEGIFVITLSCERPAHMDLENAAGLLKARTTYSRLFFLPM